MIKKLSIIITRDTLESVYPAMIIGTGASTQGVETHIFFGFFGANILVKGFEGKLKLSEDYRDYRKIFTNRIKNMGLPSIQELIRNAREMGAKIYICEGSLPFLNLSKEDLIEVVDKEVGIAEFLELVENSDLSLTF